MSELLYVAELLLLMENILTVPNPEDATVNRRWLVYREKPH